MLRTRRHLSPAHLAAACALLVACALPAAARADEPLVPPPIGAEDKGEYRWYGFGGGVAAHLAPADAIGGTVQASAAIDFTRRPDSGALLAARGTLVGVFHKDGWAFMPLLTSDAGVHLGPLALFLSGGVQIFGFARRDEITVFASFGVVGGGGFSLRLSKNVRLSLRGRVVWLPSGAAGRIEGDENADKPTFLYASGVLMLEVRQIFKELF